MTNTVIQFRCSQEQKDRWRELAARESISLSAWIVSRLEGHTDRRMPVGQLRVIADASQDRQVERQVVPRKRSYEPDPR